MKQTVTLIAALLTLSACSASNSQEPTVLPASAPAAFVINPHGSTDVAFSREAMDVLTEPASRAVLSPRSALDDAEAGAQAALAATDGISPEAASELRQTVAAMMVQRHLAADTPDMAAVGRYTDLLVAEDSPNAHLVASALTALKPTWGEARVHAAAAKTEAIATDYIARTCAGCNASARNAPAVGTVEAPDTGETHRSIQDGISRLSSL